LGTFGIVLIVVIFATMAVRSSFSHFKGEGSCCGGNVKQKRFRKKRLKGILNEKYIFDLEGMHCKACAARIENAINEVDGVAADVNFAKHIANIKSNRKLELSDIIEIIELEGYQVVQTQKV